MIFLNQNYLFFSIFLALVIMGCENKEANKITDPDELEIRKIHSEYVNGWLNSDEEGIMKLLVEDSRIQPNTLKPIDGKSEIRKFWFPNDSSKTIINNYETEIISLDIMDTLAISTHESVLDWTYKKDSISFGMFQKGINTTIYRRQLDNSWKIWRSMWTDIYVERK
ncbi:MAG: nuclear transport factor 2 family protein [Flavobacteriaceae bacterium]|nr:nuclear transport factor 2 family protein [Flavobacteriaceae bacterium]